MCCHALRRVAEEIRECCRDIDKFISNVKNVLVKFPLRVKQIQQYAPSLTLPPHPVLTRCGMWLDVATRYIEKITVIEVIF